MAEAFRVCLRSNVEQIPFAVRLCLSASVKEELVTAKMPITFKISKGLRAEECKATINVGGKTYSFSGSKFNQSTLEQLLSISDEKATGMLKANITTSCLKQERDVASIRAKLHAASHQAAEQKRKEQTVILDAPITLQVGKERSPSPLGLARQPGQPLSRGPNPSHSPQLATKPDLFTPSAPKHPPHLTSVRPKSAPHGRVQPPPPCRTIPQQQQQQSNSTKPQQQQQQQPAGRLPGTPNAQAQRQQQAVRPQSQGKARNPPKPKSMQAATVGKRKSLQTAQPSTQQQKRQHVDSPQGKQPLGGAAAAAVEAPMLGTGPRRRIHYVQAGAQPKQDVVGAAGLANIEQAQQQQGGKRRRDEPGSNHNAVSKRQQAGTDLFGARSAAAATAAGSGHVAATAAGSGCVAAANSGLGRVTATAAGSGRAAAADRSAAASGKGSVGRSGGQAGATAVTPGRANQMTRVLRGNPAGHELDEIEEGEVIEGVDGPHGEELPLTDPVIPMRVVKTAAFGRKQQGKAGNAAAAPAGLRGPAKAASKQLGKQNPRMAKTTADGQEGRLQVPAPVSGKQQRASNKEQKLTKPAQPADCGVLGPKSVGEVEASKLQGQQQQQQPVQQVLAQAQQQHLAGNDMSYSKQGQELHAGAAAAQADSNASSRLLLSSLTASTDSRQLQHTPVGTPTSSNASRGLTGRAVDLGPPGYEEFINRKARNFTPISSEEQYFRYLKQHESHREMYCSLQLLSESFGKSISAAHDRYASAPTGSVEQQQASSDNQRVLSGKQPFLQKWGAAKKHLQQEIQALKNMMEEWRNPVGQ